MTEIKTQGVTLGRALGTSPETYSTIGKLTEIPSIRLTGPKTAIDITNLDSTTKEEADGLADYYDVTFTGNLDDSDTGQGQMRTDLAAGTENEFVLTLTDSSPATTLTFDARVTDFSISGGMDDILKFSLTLRVNPAGVTWA